MFEQVSIFITGDGVKTGTLSLRFYELSVGIYLKENDCNSSDPFQDPFSINPFRDAYQNISGHHLIDLSYYSEFTVIERTFRICFHDISQEIGISLNFINAKECLDFFNFLKANLTIVSPELQSLYIILRLCPSISKNDIYFCRNKNNTLKNQIPHEKDNVEYDQDDLFASHSSFISKITPNHKRVIADIDDLNEGFLSKENMKKLLYNHNISNDKKADVWGYLIGIYPLNEIPKERRETYSRIKNQWTSITKSQYLRSKIIYQDINTLIDCIKNNKQKIMTVIPDRIIIKIVFNVLMSLRQLYHFLDGHYNDLIMIIRVFLWMFVKDTVFKKGEKLFIIHDDLLYDNEELETVLFWSMLYFIEKNEVRRLYENEEIAKIYIIEEINNFISSTHPEMHKLLQQKGISDFNRIIPLFTMGFSSILPFCDCADLWITAMSSSNFYLFIEYMIISCIFFNFPNILLLPQGKKQDIIPFIEQIFLLLDHYYVENTTFRLMENVENLLNSNS